MHMERDDPCGDRPPEQTTMEARTVLIDLGSLPPEQAAITAWLLAKHGPSSQRPVASRVGWNHMQLTFRTVEDRVSFQMSRP